MATDDFLAIANSLVTENSLAPDDFPATDNSLSTDKSSATDDALKKDLHTKQPPGLHAVNDGVHPGGAARVFQSGGPWGVDVEHHLQDLVALQAPPVACHHISCKTNASQWPSLRSAPPSRLPV